MPEIYDNVTGLRMTDLDFMGAPLRPGQSKEMTAGILGAAREKQAWLATPDSERPGGHYRTEEQASYQYIKKRTRGQPPVSEQEAGRRAAVADFHADPVPKGGARITATNTLTGDAVGKEFAPGEFGSKAHPATMPPGMAKIDQAAAQIKAEGMGHASELRRQGFDVVYNPSVTGPAGDLIADENGIDWSRHDENKRLKQEASRAARGLPPQGPGAERTGFEVHGIIGADVDPANLVEGRLYTDLTDQTFRVVDGEPVPVPTPKLTPPEMNQLLFDALKDQINDPEIAEWLESGITFFDPDDYERMFRNRMNEQKKASLTKPDQQLSVQLDLQESMIKQETRILLQAIVKAEAGIGSAGSGTSIDEFLQQLPPESQTLVQDQAGAGGGSFDPDMARDRIEQLEVKLGKIAVKRLELESRRGTAPPEATPPPTQDAPDPPAVTGQSAPASASDQVIAQTRPSITEARTEDGGYIFGLQSDPGWTFFTAPSGEFYMVHGIHSWATVPVNGFLLPTPPAGIGRAEAEELLEAHMPKGAYYAIDGQPYEME